MHVWELWVRNLDNIQGRIVADGRVDMGDAKQQWEFRGEFNQSGLGMRYARNAPI